MLSRCYRTTPSDRIVILGTVMYYMNVWRSMGICIRAIPNVPRKLWWSKVGTFWNFSFLSRKMHFPRWKASRLTISYRIASVLVYVMFAMRNCAVWVISDGSKDDLWLGKPFVTRIRPIDGVTKGHCIIISWLHRMELAQPAISTTKRRNNDQCRPQWFLLPAKIWLLVWRCFKDNV